MPLEFLKRVQPGSPLELGRHVLVIGGGNSAMDAARWAKRLGSETIVLFRRGRAEITIPSGTEAVIEQLPLINAGRRAIDELRREIVRFGLRHADTQPRLTIRQRGTSGTLRVVVHLLRK